MLLIRDSKSKAILVTIFGVFVAIILVSLNTFIFGAPQRSGEVERFIVQLNHKNDSTVEALYSNGFVKNKIGLLFALQLKGKNSDNIEPGGYRISKSMSAWKIANVLAEEPYMKWVVIPEGWRKEQIAELLADTLDWTDQEKSSWINTYTSMKFDEVEGVYFPDTYLISKDEELLQVADRLRARFNEVFTQYLLEANKQNIKWPTLLKIASLVQREAAGKSDMNLIAGILWNRLLNNQKLEIDVTVQYARDTRLAYNNDPCEDPDGYARDPKNDLFFNSKLLQPSVEYIGIEDWWTPIGGSDTRSIDSLYNTYLYAGLPPHPISNPGISAIEAVLYPEDTDCFYYLHDREGNIHCSTTYEEHQANIEQYLR
jgi:UPF0755 protein